MEEQAGSPQTESTKEGGMANMRSEKQLEKVKSFGGWRVECARGALGAPAILGRWWAGLPRIREDLNTSLQQAYTFLSPVAFYREIE